MIHELKITRLYYEHIVKGIKTFELRNNDRGFQVNDTLLLSEIDNDLNLTGNQCTVTISYVLENEKYGLKKGYCILGIDNPVEKTVRRTNHEAVIKCIEQILEDFGEAESIKIELK